MRQSRAMFSRRVPADLRSNRLAALRDRVTPRFDLGVSNPTRVGLDYPATLLAPLGDPAGLRYEPDPRGLRVARQAVAERCRRQGADVDADAIVLTASTSEAYALLFKLLCEPGEAVLVPSPSYPLFDHLAAAEAVAARPYHLDPGLGWRLDPDELAAAAEDVRAVVVVHPNNPTGSHVHADDARALEALCVARSWALIADEVFLDYPLGAARPSLAAGGTALAFVLGGLSKSVALPQLKLGWIIVRGPRSLAREALERLEFLADTFLSVATPVQLALPRLLDDGAVVRAEIQARCAQNLAVLAEASAADPAMTLLLPEGGWSAVLRYPAVVGEEDLACELLAEDGVAVQPGYFFDIPFDGALVLSLLPEPSCFAAGLSLVLARLHRHLAA